MSNNLIVSVSNGPTLDSNAQALTNRQEVPMTKIKTLTAVAILSTAFATPGFAKDRAQHERHFRGAYSWMTNSSFAVAKTRAGRNIQNFGFSGRDRSYPGGWNPYLNP
jgi:hypothetical protein